MAIKERDKEELLDSIICLMEADDLSTAIWASSTEGGGVAKSFIGARQDLMALIMVCIMEIVSRASREEGTDIIDKTIQILKAVRTANGGEE